MNDELTDMLNRAPQLRPPGANPRPPVGPRVQGGLPLDGGPQLQLTLSNLEATAARDAAPAENGPAVQFEPQENGQAARPTIETQRTSPDEQTVGPATAHQLVAVGLAKSYRKGHIEVPVLRELNLGVQTGEFVAVVGQSGSGKSTLLHLLGTLDAPDKGEIYFDGRRIDNLPAADRDALRNRRLGMIFQFYHLLPELTTLENVLAPLMIAHSTPGYFRGRKRHRATAVDLLEMVGLGHRLRHKPRELSGGEMQRAAIARALVARPDLLLADEPTGNLDHVTGRQIINTLRTLNRQQNLTIVMVTHDQAIADQADRVARLTDGRIEP